MNPYSRAPRTAAIVIRTLHIGSMSVYLGGRVLGAEDRRLCPWRTLTTITGAALLATEVSHSRDWIHQGRGILTLAHVGVLPAGHLDRRLSTDAAVAALFIGAVGSHLPRSVRKWSVLRRRVLP